MVAVQSSLLFFLLFIASPLYGQFRGDSWEATQKAGTGTIVVPYIEEDAFAFTDADGQLVGVTIEIAQQFFNYVQKTKNVKLNIAYEKTDDFVKFYQHVQNGTGGVFGLGNVTITDARKKEVKFSPPYMTNIAVLVTHSSVPNLTSLASISKEFAGFSAVVYKGTTHEDRIQKIKTNSFSALKLIPVNSDLEVIDKISADKKLFTYTDLSIYWLATKSNKPIKRHAIGDDVSEEFGFIMPPNSDWEPLVREFFTLGSGYRSNPAYRRILVRYLGNEVTKMLEMAQKKN